MTSAHSHSASLWAKLSCLSLGFCILATSALKAALVAHWPLDADANDATGYGHARAVVDGAVNFGQA